MNNNMTIQGLTIAEALRVYRQRGGMSICELAIKTGLSRNTISEIERGKGNPTLDTVGRIMTALGLAWRTELIEWSVKKL